MNIPFNEWKTQNIEELQTQFCNEDTQDFIEFLEQQIIDETYTMEHYIQIYCNEEREDDFKDFCKERYFEVTEQKVFRPYDSEKDLTAQQEDFILEQAREQHYEEKYGKREN